MPVTTEIDTNNEFDWAERTTNEFTLFGRDYKDVTTTFDDGHIEIENSQNGALLRFTLNDPTDALPIETQVITYASNGDTTSSNTLDDDGQRIVGTYEAGILVAETKTDESATRPWSTIEITYDDGEIEGVDIDYEQASNWSVTANFLTEISYDAENTADWMYIVEARGGNQSTTTTIDDQGGQKIERFTDDVITSTNAYDYGDVAEWSDIYEVYSGGVIATRFTSNDNGTNFIESYDNGTLVMTRLQDDGQNQPFRYIETFFDADGNAVRRETLNDTGPLVVEILRETTVQTDANNTANWTQITTVTDGDGQLIERATDYDNGNTRFETFDDGQLASRLNTEADGDTRLTTYENGQRASIVKEDVSDAKSWTSQAYTYDENGDIAGRTITFDNGSTTTNTYTGGSVASSLRSDHDDAFSWTTVASIYDANGLEGRRIDYDNGDVLVFDYEDGDRTARLRVDGDDSNSWALQLTQYEAGGNVITTYDAVEDLPEDYAYLLDSGTFDVFA